ncbi:MAG: rRNA maturation RNase YbeY [Planctomycetota bacterium]
MKSTPEKTSRKKEFIQTIHLTNFQRRYLLSEPQLTRFAQTLLNAYHQRGDLSIVFMNDRRIHLYNREYLQHDFPTDVLSFSLGDEQDSLIGEILISTETAKREANQRQISLEEEVIRYLVHGFLHLMGYEDHQESLRKQMFRIQERWVKKFFR